MWRSVKPFHQVAFNNFIARGALHSFPYIKLNPDCTADDCNDCVAMTDWLIREGSFTRPRSKLSERRGTINEHTEYHCVYFIIAVGCCSQGIERPLYHLIRIYYHFIAHKRLLSIKPAKGAAASSEMQWDPHSNYALSSMRMQILILIIALLTLSENDFKICLCVAAFV